MKKSIILIILLSAMVLSTQVQAQVSPSWIVSQNGDLSPILPTEIVNDQSGYLYVAGTFNGTRQFGTYTLTAGGSSDAFLARYDNSGNCIWAHNYGGSNSVVVRGTAVVVDNAGDIYVAGSMSDTITVGGFFLNRYGTIGTDIFLAKISQAGNVIWAKSFGGQQVDNVTPIAVDANNNIYLSGTFYGKCFFGPSDSVGGNANNTQIFIAKLDQAGSVIWLREAGSSTDDLCGVLKIQNNSLYLCGSSYGVCYFGTHSISCNNVDGFITMYDLSGTNIWVQKIGGPQADYASRISVDNYGHVFITGTIFQNATFFSVTPPNVNINAGNFDQVFIAKYDSTGKCLWAKKGGTSNQPNSSGDISSDVNGYCTVTGSFAGNAMFGSFPVSSYGGYDAFIAKYDPNGNCQYAMKCGGVGSDNGYRLVWLPGNEYVVSGTFQNTAMFGTLSVNTPAATTYATFIAKFPGATTGVGEIESNSILSIYPNPTSDVLNLSFGELEKFSRVVLVNQLGQILLDSGVLKNTQDLSLDVSHLPSGMYAVRFMTTDGWASCKVQILR